DRSNYGTPAEIREGTRVSGYRQQGRSAPSYCEPCNRRHFEKCREDGPLFIRVGMRVIRSGIVLSEDGV
ncbi:hypothetical protein HAX54_018904, partial [Datura stramonium]|nr:hypothetical protein [Datura stramonium]